MTQTVAIIVPLLNEMKVLPTLLAALLRLKSNELIFVDGGSIDGSLEYLQQHSQYSHRFRVAQGASGRAAQMNLGAQQTQADILLFLHADTCLPFTALDLVQKGQWGRFDIRFHDNQNPNSRLLDVVANMINQRSKVTGVATGDQAIYVQRKLFEEVGGFEHISLMEDVSLSKKLKRHSKPHCIKQYATTSARRWKQHGVLKTIALMWVLRAGFFFGVDPDRLWKAYRHVR